MILFDEIIFGPVLSRRLGFSLGINLLPVNRKICTFNCIYCECGWTKFNKLSAEDFSAEDIVIRLLEERLSEMKNNGSRIDSITFAGNGEPTLHPDFSSIIDNTIVLRNKYYPEAKITVLSNATFWSGELGVGSFDKKIRIKESIINSLKKVDKNMLKLDAGKEETFQLLNKPRIKITLQEIINNLKMFNGDLIIQSLFVKGEHKGIIVDNTEENEVNEWLKNLKVINPKLVVIYSLSREPADKKVLKVSMTDLEKIAEKIRCAGLKVEIYN